MSSVTAAPPPARLAGGWRRRVVTPSAAAVLAVVLAWLAFGVHPAEILLFAGFELLFVLVPGVLLRLALPHRDEPWLESLALGWALGLALELAAFALTAALGVRVLFALYPVPVYAVAAVVVARRGPRGAELRRRVAGVTSALRLSWAAAALVAVGAAYLALSFFAFTPPARSVASVTYPQDLVFHLSLSAEALHHWPIGDPSVAGRTLKYHTFANMDLAAISQVTGLPLDIVLFRLWPVPVLAAIALLLANLCRLLGGSARAALVAAGLALLAGEIDVDTRQTWLFQGATLFPRIESPSFLFGAVFFLAALQVLFRSLQVAGPPTPMTMPPRARAGAFALLAILLAAASGAKASILPVLLGGFALCVAVDLVRRRRIAPDAVGAGALLLLVFAVSYLVLYRGSHDAGFELRLFDFGRYIAPDAPQALKDGAMVFSLLPMLAPLIGLLGWVLARRRAASGSERLVIGLLVASVGAFVVLAQSGGSQIYFLLYGYLAAIPLSALGLELAWTRVAGRDGRLALRVIAGAGVLLAVVALAAHLLGNFDKPKTVAGLAAAYLLMVLAAAASLIIAKGARSKRATALATFLSLTLAVACLDLPIDAGTRLVPHWSKGEHVWSDSDPDAERGLNAGLLDALTWIRDSTSTSSLVAVNNFNTFAGFPRYFYYSAYAQRRIYLQGWGYTPEGNAADAGRPLPPWMIQRARASVSAAMGYEPAVAFLRRDHVRYLLVDRINSQYVNTLALDAIHEPVFTNDEASVYDLADF